MLLVQLVEQAFLFLAPLVQGTGGRARIMEERGGCGQIRARQSCLPPNIGQVSNAQRSHNHHANDERPSKGEAVTTPPALIERVRDLAAQGKGDAEIAADGIEAWAAEVGQIRKRYFDGKFKIGAGPQLADK
jgi:hypothetical protein